MYIQLSITILVVGLLISTFHMVVFVNAQQEGQQQATQNITTKDSIDTNASNLSSLSSPSSLAELGKKCVNVLRDELSRGDLPVAILFVVKIDQILSAISGNNSNIVNNSTATASTTLPSPAASQPGTPGGSINPYMCDWDDPESGQIYR
jgi:hypothetical protein